MIITGRRQTLVYLTVCDGAAVFGIDNGISSRREEPFFSKRHYGEVVSLEQKRTQSFIRTPDSHCRQLAERWFIDF